MPPTTGSDIALSLSFVLNVLVEEAMDEKKCTLFWDFCDKLKYLATLNTKIMQKLSKANGMSSGLESIDMVRLWKRYNSLFTAQFTTQCDWVALGWGNAALSQVWDPLFWFQQHIQRFPPTVAQDFRVFMDKNFTLLVGDGSEISRTNVAYVIENFYNKKLLTRHQKQRIEKAVSIAFSLMAARVMQTTHVLEFLFSFQSLIYWDGTVVKLMKDSHGAVYDESICGLWEKYHRCLNCRVMGHVGRERKLYNWENLRDPVPFCSTFHFEQPDQTGNLDSVFWPIDSKEQDSFFTRFGLVWDPLFWFQQHKNRFPPTVARQFKVFMGQKFALLVTGPLRRDGAESVVADVGDVFGVESVVAKHSPWMLTEYQRQQMWDRYELFLRSADCLPKVQERFARTLNTLLAFHSMAQSYPCKDFRRKHIAGCVVDTLTAVCADSEDQIWWSTFGNTPGGGASLCAFDSSRIFNHDDFVGGVVAGAIRAHLATVILRDLDIIEDFHLYTPVWFFAYMSTGVQYGYMTPIREGKRDDQYRMTYSIKNSDKYREIRWERETRGEGGVWLKLHEWAQTGLNCREDEDEDEEEEHEEEEHEEEEDDSEDDGEYHDEEERWGHD